ncbi:hypothetical protein TB2_007622 [Malus domestica]
MGTRSQQQPGRERAGQDDDDMAGGQSVSMSGSVGSPSSRSEQTMATPAGDNSFLRLNHPDIHGDDAGSQGVVGSVTSLPPFSFCFWSYYGGWVVGNWRQHESNVPGNTSVNFGLG